MGMAVSRTAALNIAILARKLLRQKRQKFVISRFAHTTEKQTEVQAARNIWPSMNANALINTIPYPGGYANKSVKGGGDRHVIPQLRALSGKGVSGDTVVLGTGGENELDYVELFVNQKRWEHQVKVGTMPEIRLGEWAEQMAQQVGPELADLFMRWESWYSIMYALTRGYSEHIIGSGAGEFGIVERHHPNMCFPGLPFGTATGGKSFCTWSATTATYEQYLARNACRLPEGGSQTQMSAQILRILENSAEEKRMTPFNIGGQERFLVMVTPDQWHQLLSDPEFRGSLQHWANQANDQSKVYFSDAQALFSRFAIFKSRFGPCEVYPHKEDGDITTVAALGDATKLEYGPLTATATERDLTDVTIFRTLNADEEENPNLRLRMGWVFGTQAAMGMECKPMTFKTEEWDYENKKGKALAWVGGHARCDFYNNMSPASATAVENTSSMPFITDSPLEFVAAA